MEMGKGGYFLCTFMVCAVNCGVVIGIFSSMGCDETCIDLLIENSWISYACAFLCFCVLLLLYLLDFFYPPHLPGQKFTFGPNDTVKGPLLISFVVVAFLGACYFSAESYPGAPLGITIFLTPCFLALLRQILRPPEPPHAELAGDVDLEERMDALRSLVEFEKDQRRFYGATAAALFSTAFISGAVWVVWVILSDDDHKLDNLNQGSSNEEDLKRDKLIILWFAPVVASGSYIVFGMIAGCRVVLSQSYSRTDGQRNQMLVDAENAQAHQKALNRRITQIRARITVMPGKGTDSEEMHKMDTATKERILNQHATYMKKMTNAFKLLVCGFVIMISIIYVLTIFVASQSQIAKMVQMFMVGYFFTILGFVYMSFKRVYQGMKVWIKDMPLIQSAMSMTKSDWIRSAGLAMFLPIFPLLLCLSAVNQCVRKCRGIYKAVPEDVVTSESVFADCIEGADVEQELGADSQDLKARLSETDMSGRIEVEASNNSTSVQKKPTLTKMGSKMNAADSIKISPKEMEMSMLTHRFNLYIAYMRTWDRISIISKIYIWSALIVLYTLSTPLLNVFLAWLRWMLQDLSFIVICLATFFSGLILFLLPPVPGAPVYLFGGVIIVQKYMTDDMAGGFPVGASICIALCFCLKLTACAMQQKLIGENFGGSSYVRQTCMVHTPFMRAVENLLSRRGLSFGKCVILVGGPDWPTSVLAGVLKLSLLQCEIGTSPIIFYVAPLALTGCFIPMTSKGEVYQKLSQLMYVLTMLMTVILWAAIAWVIQTEMDKNYEALNRPMVKYLDLDWLDYKAEQVKSAKVVSWDYVPSCLKAVVIGGAIACDVAAWFFYQFPQYCLGAFEVTDEITELKVFDGNDGLIKPGGAGSLFAILIGFLILYGFNRWKDGVTRAKVAEENERLDALEAEWKETRRQLAEAAEAEADMMFQGLGTIEDVHEEDEENDDASPEVLGRSEAEDDQNPPGEPSPRSEDNVENPETVLVPGFPHPEVEVKTASNGKKKKSKKSQSLSATPKERSNGENGEEADNAKE